MIITDKTKLLKRSENASIFEALEIIKKLELELEKSEIPGIGLSSPQIGIQKAVCIIRMPSVSLNLYLLGMP